MYILFDIGGSRMRIAATEDLENFSEPTILETPKNFEEGMQALAGAIRDEAAGRSVVHIVGGLPGTLLGDQSGLNLAKNLPTWEKQPIRERLKVEFGGAVTLVNDAGLVALGEAVYGAGKGARIVSYLTFSTGVGGARVTEGVLDAAAYNFEPGKLPLSSVEDAELATIETYASGKGLEDSLGKPPREITDQAVWHRAAKAAARGVHAATLFWSPDIVVVGGPMIVGDPAIPFTEIYEEAETLLGERRGELTLKKAELGALGGLWGGMAKLRTLL